MKVGILTFHKVINYGAVLQAYALNRYINENGIDCEDIDYTAKKIRNFYNPFKIEKFSDLKDLLDFFLNLIGRFRTIKKFRLFRSQYIRFSKKCFDNCIKEANGRYDLLICGSDQIWNNKITGEDLNYFFSFDKVSRKASYAASFGAADISSNKDTILKLLTVFSHITVRESSSISLLNNCISNKVRLVLDPVFLLPSKEWSLLANNKKILDGKYIFLFNLKNNIDVITFVKQLSKEKGMEIVTLSNSSFYNHSFRKISGGGPIEFLYLIKNAEYIVTDSFHATSLSIIFNKVFFVGLNKTQIALNSRLNSLLTLFDLQKQIISKDINYNINYTRVNQIMDIEKKKSEMILDKILNNIPF